MSNKELSRVIEKSTFDATDLLTLILLADQATDEGLCFGRISTIAKKIRKSERQTIRVIVKLHAGSELGILERKGRSNVYVILSGLTIGESIARMKAAVEAEGGKIREVKGIVTPDADVTPSPDVAVSGAPDADVTRIPSLSPAVNPPDGADEPKAKKEKPRDLVFDAIADVCFGIKDYRQINGDGGRIGPIRGWLKKHEPEVTPERIRTFGVWYDKDTRDPHSGKPLSRPRDLHKFQERWVAFEQSQPVTAVPTTAADGKPTPDGKPVSPLVTQLGVSQEELDANPGLQEDLERIYREQGRIK